MIGNVIVMEQSLTNGRVEHGARALRVPASRSKMEDGVVLRSFLTILWHSWLCGTLIGFQNFLGTSDVDLTCGGTINIIPHEAPTRNSAPSNVTGFQERVFVLG